MTLIYSPNPPPENFKNNEACWNWRWLFYGDETNIHVDNALLKHFNSAQAEIISRPPAEALKLLRSFFNEKVTEDVKARAMEAQARLFSSHYSSESASSGSEIEIYIRNIARRWKLKLAISPAKKYIFSPYITSGTAESVLSITVGEKCEIHTLFSADVFASKASSLKTLKKLLASGHSLFFLPNLHAKIVLVPGFFATIGSQNLTTNGTRNKEASVLIKDEKQILKIEKEIMRWMPERIPITLEMIDDMEMSLKNFEPEFEAFNLAIEKCNQTVRDKQLEREVMMVTRADELLRQKKIKQEEELKLAKLRLEALREAEEQQRQRDAERGRQARVAFEDVKERERRLQRLRYNISSTPKSLETADGVVSQVHEGSLRTQSDDRYSLLSRDGRDLTIWSVAGRQIKLTRAMRYLILKQSGKLGWARVMQSRLTFVESSIHCSERVILADLLLEIKIDADWSETPKYGRNVVFEVIDPLFGLADCTISAWFDLHDLTLLKIDTPDYVAPGFAEHNTAIACVRNGWPAIKEFCLNQILRPFRYKHNLTGYDALVFFGDVGTKVCLSAAMVADNPVILSSQQE